MAVGQLDVRNHNGAAACKKSLFSVQYSLFVFTPTTDLIPGGSGASGCKKSLFGVQIFSLFVLTSTVVLRE